MMKCRYCGANNPETSTKCQNCNRLLTEAVAEDAATIVQQNAEFNETLFNSQTFSRRYKVIQLLGKGGMGKVYKAWDKELEEEVAIKILIPELSFDTMMLARFKREIKLARSITHENVCKIYDLGEAEGIKYISMAYIEGESLKDLLSKKKKLKVDNGMEIIEQIADALDAFHKKGITHRDLKPSNIMIDQQGKIHIMDFGIAKSVESDGLTKTGEAVGTPAYMAPEQIEGKKVDNRADIYSLGVIMYRMFTGQPVYEAESSFSLALKHLQEEPRKPREINPQIPEHVERIILKCLKKKPDERYSSASEIIKDYKKVPSAPEPATILLEETPPAKVQKPPAEKRPRFNIKKIALLAGAGIVIAAGMIFIYLKITKKEVPTTEMVQIPAGEFIMGSDDFEDDEKPQRTIHLKAFYIDKYEVTNTQYKAYVDDSGAAVPPNWIDGKIPPDMENHPVVGITWDEATAYAHWAGKRLPSEEEWEKAARGIDGRTYPWGNEFNAHYANIGRNSTSDVGIFPEDKSPFGVFDMAGNVREWTSTRDKVNISGETQEVIRIKGGSWGPTLPTDYARCSHRGWINLSDKNVYTVVGFRCAKDAKK